MIKKSTRRLILEDGLTDEIKIRRILEESKHELTICPEYIEIIRLTELMSKIIYHNISLKKVLSNYEINNQ